MKPKQKCFFEEEFNLPPELAGVDIEPDEIPEIKINNTITNNYIIIDYDAGESLKINELAGTNFLRRGHKKYVFKKNIVEKEESLETPWVNDEPYSVLILFEENELDDIIKMFHIPQYKKNEIFKYRLKDIINKRTLL